MPARRQHAERQARAGTVGIAGRAAEEVKRSGPGTKAGQRARGNTLTMSERCNLHNIHFWPVGLEGDGVMTKAFSQFLNNVCDAAKKFKGLNRATFKSYFSSRIANTLHQTSAMWAIRRASAERAKLVNTHGHAVFGSVDDNELALELQVALPVAVSQRRAFRNRHSNASARPVTG